MVFETIVTTMVEMTVFQVFFPWLLVLAITYGVLDQYNTVSEEDSVNAMIALAISFMAVGGTYLFIPEGMLTELVAGLTFGLFAVLGFLIIMGTAGFDLEQLEDGDSLPFKIGTLIFLISVITVGFGYTNAWERFVEFVGDPGVFFDEILMPIIVLLFLLGIVKSTVGASDEE